jgi:HEAT repeat protein
LRGARHDLTEAEKRALHRRAGGCDSDWRGPNGWEFQRVDGPGGPATPALTACELLVRAQDSRAAPALVAVLAGAKVASSVRRAAGRALLGLQARWLVDAAPACIAIVDDDRDGEACLRVRWAAVRLLGRIGSPAADPAVPALVKFLFENGGLVLPPLAALALGGIGTAEAREALDRMALEMAPGTAAPERRRSADLELIQQAVAAALGKGETPDVRDLEDADFAGCDMRGAQW